MAMNSEVIFVLNSPFSQNWEKGARGIEGRTGIVFWYHVQFWEMGFPKHQYKIETRS